MEATFHPYYLLTCIVGMFVIPLSFLLLSQPFSLPSFLPSAALSLPRSSPVSADRRRVPLAPVETQTEVEVLIPRPCRGCFGAPLCGRPSELPVDPGMGGPRYLRSSWVLSVPGPFTWMHT